jgi:hypothetical protein
MFKIIIGTAAGDDKTAAYPPRYVEDGVEPSTLLRMTFNILLLDRHALR